MVGNNAMTSQNQIHSPFLVLRGGTSFSADYVGGQPPGRSCESMAQIVVTG